MRVADGAKKEKTDEAGRTYWIHALAGVPGHAQHDGPLAEPEAGRGNYGLDPEGRNKGYRAILGALELSDGHRVALHARGLTDEQIEEAGYKTITNTDQARLARIARECLGDDEETGFKQLPGIYYDRGARECLLYADVGLAIPIRDEGGQVVGLQVRRDTDEKDRRYTWVSTGFKGGAKVGAPAHFSVALGNAPAAHLDAATKAEMRRGYAEDAIRITEGALKADVAAALSGLPTIGCAGLAVTPAVALLARFGIFRLVRLAFDADMATNVHVARAVAQAYKQFAREGYRVEVETWDGTRAKGVDDALKAGVPIRVLRRYEAREFIRGLERRARAEVDLARYQGEARGLYDKVELYLSRDERRAMNAAAERSTNELFKNSMKDAACCGSAEQHSRCRKENAIVLVSRIAANRPRLCAHCNKVWIEAICRWADTDGNWPDEIGVTRIESTGGPSEMRGLRRRVKALWRRMQARSHPSRFVFSTDHALILTTRDGLDRVRLACGKLGLHATHRVLSRRDAVWGPFAYAMALVGIQHRLWIAKGDWAALEASPWLQNVERQTSANREGQAVFHVLNAAEIAAAVSRKKRNTKPKGMCPNEGCDGALDTEIVSTVTGKRLHRFQGGPVAERDALKIVRACCVEDWNDPTGEEPITDAQGAVPVADEEWIT